MNIYLLTQNENNGYDTFSGMVVTAENKEQAKLIHPYSDESWNNDWDDSWASKPENVTAELIGTGNGKVNEIILSSFHAG